MVGNEKRQWFDTDFFSAMDHVEEQKEALWSAWIAWVADSRQDFERVIRAAIQELESLKNRCPELNVSVPYLLGKLDGYTELFERLYREKLRRSAAAEVLTPQTPKVRQILLYLYENDGTRHGDLATAVGSSYSSLTNIMKKILLSGAVEAVRSGRNTCYHLTEAGRQYCKRSLHSDKELTRTILEIVRETVQTYLNAPKRGSLPTQRVQAGEKLTLIVDNETQDPVMVNQIIEADNQKFVDCSSCIENTEKDDPMLIIHWPVLGYNH